MKEMKDSGVGWVGKIPKNWDITPLYVYFGERKHLNSKEEEKNLLSLSYGNIIRKNINSNDGLLPENFAGYNIVEPNDIVIRPTDLQNDQHSLRTGLVNEHGIITSAYITLKPNHGVNSKYYHYLLHSYDIEKVFYNMGDGVRQGIKYSQFSKLRVVVPSANEQQVIVDFLDSKCSKIDSAISLAQSQIDALKRYKTAVITQAVTKGLDPNVEMKDSGVEWIGKIPKNWEVKKLKYACSMQAGENITSENIESNGDYLVYGGNGIRGYYYKYNYTGEHVLIGRQGALAGNIHYVNGKIWATDHAVVTKRFKENPKYLFYVLKAMNLNQFAFDTAAQPGLSVTRIMNLLMVFPTYSEEEKISIYLDDKCDKIDSAISKQESIIDKLNEYKKSLIYNAVTGKIDCREAEA